MAKSGYIYSVDLPSADSFPKTIQDKIVYSVVEGTNDKFTYFTQIKVAAIVILLICLGLILPFPFSRPALMTAMIAPYLILEVFLRKSRGLKWMMVAVGIGEGFKPGAGEGVISLLIKVDANAEAKYSWVINKEAYGDFPWRSAREHLTKVFNQDRAKVEPALHEWQNTLLNTWSPFAELYGPIEFSKDPAPLDLEKIEEDDKFAKAPEWFLTNNDDVPVAVFKGFEAKDGDWINATILESTAELEGVIELWNEINEAYNSSASPEELAQLEQVWLSRKYKFYNPNQVEVTPLFNFEDPKLVRFAVFGID